MKRWNYRTRAALRAGVLGMLGLWGGLTVCPAADRYVTPPGGLGTNNYPYASWADAATNIQWAVDAASSGETVWVAGGNYCLTQQVVLTNWVNLFSTDGYSNTLAYADYPTHTTRCLYASNPCVVDGFTFSNGFATGSAFSDCGGGALITHTVLVQNCAFVGNVSSNNRGEGGGGGIAVYEGSVVSNCLVYTNVAMKLAAYESGCGAGIFLRGGKALGCTVISNSAWAYGYGGGIYAAAESDFVVLKNVVSNCVVMYNEASSGGGIYNGFMEVVDCVVAHNKSKTGGGIRNMAVARNCVVSNNSATVLGGGIMNVGRAGTAAPGVWVSNCVIVGNSCDGGYSDDYKGGGGVVMGDGFLRDCRIYNNVCKGQWGGGGVMITNKATSARQNPTYIMNCLIYNNTSTVASGSGGGVLVLTGSPTGGYNVVNCTIAGNYSANVGGGVGTRGASNTILNSVIAGNTAAAGSPDIYNLDPTTTNHFHHSCSPTLELGPERGNVFADPKYAAAGAADFRLRASSPCIDAGTNMNWMTNAVDLAGNPRIRFDVVDMGAYELLLKIKGAIFHVR